MVGVAGERELSAVLKIQQVMSDGALEHTIEPATILSPNANALKQLVGLERKGEAVSGVFVATRDAGVRAFAPQRARGDRFAVRQHLVGAEGGVTGAYEGGRLAGDDLDALSVVELAIRRARRRRPVAVDDVAAGQICVDHAGDVARRRNEAGELGHLSVHRLGLGRRRRRRGPRHGPLCRHRGGACGLRAGGVGASGKDEQGDHTGNCGGRTSARSSHGATIARQRGRGRRTVKCGDTHCEKRIRAESRDRANLRPRSTFGRAPRSRSSGGERPPHTRKVTGSIPVGTTLITARQSLYIAILDRFCAILML